MKRATSDNIPTFKVNLDLPPNKRWKEISLHYKDKIKNAISEAEEILGKGPLSWIVQQSFSFLNKVGAILYCKEIEGIAEVLDQPVGKVAMLQLAYEVSTCCTSIIAHDKNDKPLHFRSMDWSMKSLLPITFNVEFLKNGELIYTGTTWPGYVGLLTGMKKDGFSISINYRRKGDSIFNNLLGGMVSYWPISFLVRNVLEKAKNYEEAKYIFSSAKIMAPCYITLAGINKNQGVIITRNRTNHEKLLELQDSKNGCIVQTNIDHWRGNEEENNWQDIEFSRFRRQFTYEYINKNGKMDNEKFWSLLDTVPIEAFDTLYKTGMSPSNNYYETRDRSGNYKFGDLSYMEKFENLENLGEFTDY